MYDTDKIRIYTTTEHPSGKIIENFLGDYTCRIETSSKTVRKYGNWVRVNWFIQLAHKLPLKEKDKIILLEKNGQSWHDNNKYEVLTVSVPDGFGCDYMEVYC
jgi:hypothetical protein